MSARHANPLVHRNADGDLLAFDTRKKRWVRVSPPPRPASLRWAIVRLVGFFVFAAYIISRI